MVNIKGHERVRELTHEGRSTTDIVAETGLARRFVEYARERMSRAGIRAHNAPGVLDGAIVDVETFHEAWAGSIARREPRWDSASAEDRARLVAALVKCRTTMSRAIKWLNKEAEGDSES